MLATLVLVVTLLAIALLLVRASHVDPLPSPACWIAFCWIAIVGSRSVSDWFGNGFSPDTPRDYLQGSPLDANIYLVLLVAAVAVLSRRTREAGRVLLSNPWFLLFMVFCFVSIAWSAHPYVAFKRWIKDGANVAIVLLMLTEKEPLAAVRGVFLRYAYVAVPLSVVFIKYFPEIGRYMDRWTWQYRFSGITTEKNALGLIAVVCTIFLLWELIDTHAERHAAKAQQRPPRRAPLDMFISVAMLLLALWLLDKSDSSTALASIVIGASILLFPRAFRRLGIVAISIAVPALCVYFALGHSFADVLADVSELLGRDETLTGRTELWQDLIDAPISRAIGAGYQSFWLGWQAEALWEKYYFHPNQAHNGYLETYLNGGLIGVGVLLAMLVPTWRKLGKEVATGGVYPAFRFSLFIMAVLSNWTEATFNRLSLTWILLIVAMLDYRAAQVAHPVAVKQRVAPSVGKPVIAR